MWTTDLVPEASTGWAATLNIALGDLTGWVVVKLGAASPVARTILAAVVITSEGWVNRSVFFLLVLAAESLQDHCF